MNTVQPQMTEQNTMKCRFPVLVLSIISFFITVLGCIQRFFQYDYTLRVSIDGQLYSDSDNELLIRFPAFFDIVPLLLMPASIVLLFVYALSFYGKRNTRVFVTVICALIAFPAFLTICNGLYSGTASDVKITIRAFWLVIFTLAAFLGTKESKYKFLIIIAASYGVLFETVYINNTVIKQ